MDDPAAIDRIADNGGEHLEAVPLDLKLEEEPKLAEAIVAKAAERGSALSNYAIGAAFAKGQCDEVRCGYGNY